MTSQTLTIRRMSAGTIYKLVSIGLTFSVAPFGLLMGVLALFGSDTVTWNGAYLYGLGGLFAGVLIGGLLSVLLAGLIGTACVLGLWLYSRIGITEITFIPADATATETEGHATTARAA